MKKITTLFLMILGIGLLNSCSPIFSHDIDGIMVPVIKEEQHHLNRYNQIQRMTKDTNVINYIDTVKISLRDDANKTYGALRTRSGTDKSQEMLKIYIDSCYVK